MDPGRLRRRRPLDRACRPSLCAWATPPPFLYAILTPTGPPPHGVFAGDGSRMSRCEGAIPAIDRIPHSEDQPMPTWLIVTCALCIALAAAYLLYVILNPEKF
jgi:hypothetical protein